ncbi:P1 family peptidase [Geoalkalibacter halelectricus]|uniref:P1 family peptidase n=1 Tax=Geoalkalibacter halelectricus TaxID=2847045 RepID=A0ABY5ZJY4_9BACT|nr:P1 family peptidase [Geoalkalibacter halelectricus]MDO3380182.1 P1 family peptidase [Geoalkalibacter halelectricus]UWZ78245.1 P1 family peptidase [Geoalkalibacter halelectricus]
MRITLAYNLRGEDTEAQAELLTEEDVERVFDALKSLGHAVVPIEVSGSPDDIIDGLVDSRPDLIFNVAEGIEGQMREAFYPAIYKHLGLPFTGGGSGLLLVDLDKRLCGKLLSVRGIRVPRGLVLTPRKSAIPDYLRYPLFIKPNYEGSGKGIHQDSVADTQEQAARTIEKLLRVYPQGVCVEEFIRGRELTVPMLESWPGRLLGIVEHSFPGAGHNIYDYELKHSRPEEGRVQVHCPPKLSPQEEMAVFSLAERVFQVMVCPDFGRVDMRLSEDGTPFFIEINPLPSLHPEYSLMCAARAKGLEYTEVIERIVRSAARRYGLPLGEKKIFAGRPEEKPDACRKFDIGIGRFAQGKYNAITDVEGVKVGHVTQVRDDVPAPDESGKTTSVRTGVTAIVPEFGDIFNNHLPSGGFILNGIGEMSGLTQAMEWGWLETPILLTNTMSVGAVHSGIIRHMIDRHPELGRKVDVIIPVVAETSDAFLNDVRVFSNTPEHALEAIRKAVGGEVEQGSVGAGTGLISFDFSGGIGSSSRRLPAEGSGYTVGVLVQSNFGRMRNLTVDGAVVGRELDPLFPYDQRRGISYGSVIVVVATNAPLLSAQLNRLAKRAALGLGRVGSYAATTSGEIIFAFSTANRTTREAKESPDLLSLDFVGDRVVNLLYEAVIEATEEAVLNAMFYSAGMSGRKGRYAPPIPRELVREILAAAKAGRVKAENG